MPDEKVEIKDQPIPLDISEKVTEILDDPGVEYKSGALDEYLRTLRDQPSLSITTDWRGLNWARWMKAFLEDFSAKRIGQRRIASIRCNDSEYAEAANIFSSGVKWIKIDQ